MLTSFWVLACAGEYHNASCAAGSVLSCALNLIVFDHDSSWNINFEIVRYVVFTILRKIYWFLRRIHGNVDARELKRKFVPNESYILLLCNVSGAFLFCYIICCLLTSLSCFLVSFVVCFCFLSNIVLDGPWPISTNLTFITLRLLISHIGQ